MSEKRLLIGKSKAEILKAMEQLAKLQAEDKIKLEPIKPREPLEPPKIIKPREEIERLFRPNRRNKGHRPIF